MGYVAVKGGSVAIEESIKRIKYERLKRKKVVEVEDIHCGMRGLIDQVMSESSLYSRKLASVAIKQAEGNPEEAVFLLRAYRSTLPRKYYTKCVDTSKMLVERRISASFKDIPGGQILGSSYDYTHRIIDFELMEESKEESFKWVEEFLKESCQKKHNCDLSNLPKVVTYLRKEGLIDDVELDNKEPIDITKKNLEFPTERSERLQVLTRGQSGAVTSLGYAALRGYGDTHPTVGELRVGKIPLYIDIFSDDNEDDEYYIGEIKITEVESFIPKKAKGKLEEDKIKFEIGYGICFGQNETKAIAMSILDNCLETKDESYPTHNEEFILYHIDSVESSGFISHLKLPHYVTFQSELDSARKTHKGESKDEYEL